MKDLEIEPKWISKVIKTREIHNSKKKDNPKWRIQDTAKLLKRSIGSISEDLLLANWLRSHRVYFDRFDYAKDALEYIRKREKEMELEDIK